MFRLCKHFSLLTDKITEKVTRRNIKMKNTISFLGGGLEMPCHRFLSFFGAAVFLAAVGMNNWGRLGSKYDYGS